MKKIYLIALLFIGLSSKAQYFQHVYGTGQNDVLSSGITTFVTAPGYLLAGTTNNAAFNSIIPVSFTNLPGNVPGGAYFQNTYTLTRFGAIVDAYDPQSLERQSCPASGGQLGIIGRYVDNNTGGPNNTGVFFMQLLPGGAVGPVFDYHPFAGSTYEVAGVGGIARSLLFPGNVYVTGTVVDVSGISYPFAICINECSGALLWGQVYLIGAPVSNAYGRDVEENPQFPFGFASIAIVGEAQNGPSNDGFLLHIDAATGVVAPHPVIIYGFPNTNDHLNSINQALAGPFPPGFVLGGGTDMITPGSMDYLVIRMDMLIAPQFSTVLDYSIFPGAYNDCYDAIQRVNTLGNAEYYATGYTNPGALGGTDALTIKIDLNGVGVPFGEFTYGGTGNDYGDALAQRPVGGAGAGLSTFGTWGSFPSIGGSDMYHVKSYFNGLSGCNEKRNNPVQYGGPQPMPQMPAVQTQEFYQTVIKATPAVSRDITLCFNNTIPGGNNARIAPDEDKDKTKSAVMPNPMETGIHAIIVEFEAETPGDVVITIYDMLGKQYYSGSFTSTKGTNRIPLDLTDINMAAGMYNVTIVNGGNAMNQLLMVK